MASKTAITTLRREIRKDNMNRKARNAKENKGTTPKFPLHTPEADANAPEQAKKA